MQCFTSGKTATKSREIVFYQTEKKATTFPFLLFHNVLNCWADCWTVASKHPLRNDQVFHKEIGQGDGECGAGGGGGEAPEGDVGAEDHGWLNHWLSVLSALICTFSLRLNWVDQLMFVFFGWSPIQGGDSRGNFVGGKRWGTFCSIGIPTNYRQQRKKDNRFGWRIFLLNIYQQTTDNTKQTTNNTKQRTDNIKQTTNWLKKGL